MHTVAAIVTMRVHDPAPAICGDRAAIAPRATGGTQLARDDLPVLHWRHDARFGEFHATTERDYMKIVKLVLRTNFAYYKNQHPRALSGAHKPSGGAGSSARRWLFHQRSAKYRPGEIRVMNSDGSIEQLIVFDT
jgi:hypothetical protein